MDKTKEISLPIDGRVIVISDIHGEIILFKKLLKKVNFSNKDYLIINGDLCEKGSNSAEVVQYMMKLTSKYPNVHVIEGNCDTLVEDLLDENPKLITYLSNRKHSLLNEWLKELSFHLDEHTKVQEVKKILVEHYSKEMNWLLDLPTVIETDEYLFVHAGVENCDNWKDTERYAAISMPAFLEKEHRSNKYVIVGHWPVVNYSTDIPNNNPIIDEKKKIIAIDGGNVIKSTGQLNAFMIDRKPTGDLFSYTYADNSPTRKVIRNFSEEREMIGCISYPNYHINPIEKGNHFTLCSQVDTNKQLYIKNEYICQNENGRYTVKSDLSCAQLSVKKGEVVSVIDDTCSGYTLIKKEGKVGWIDKSSLT